MCTPIVDFSSLFPIINGVTDTKQKFEMHVDIIKHMIEIKYFRHQPKVLLKFYLVDANRTLEE